MNELKLPLTLTLMLSLGTACASAGRQAAWEKDGAAGMTQTSTSGAAQKVAEAEMSWQKRDDKVAVQAAITAWEDAAKADGNNAAVRVNLARAYYFLGDAHVALEPGEKGDELMGIYEKGADWGEEALILLDPAFAEKMKGGADFTDAVGQIPKDAVPAAYWYCTNLGRFAVQKGLSAKLYYKDRVAAAMARIKELDENFFYAGADRYFGAFYSALPSIAGKDVEKSKVHFAKAMELAPEYLPNQVVKAEFLAVELDDQDMYENLLKAVLSAPDGEDPNIAPENRAAKRQAKKKLSMVDDVF